MAGVFCFHRRRHRLIKRGYLPTLGVGATFVSSSATRVNRWLTSLSPTVFAQTRVRQQQRMQAPMMPRTTQSQVRRCFGAVGDDGAGDQEGRSATSPVAACCGGTEGAGLDAFSGRGAPSDRKSAPHSAQNREPSGFSVPQLGQVITLSSSVPRVSCEGNGATGCPPLQSDDPAATVLARLLRSSDAIATPPISTANQSVANRISNVAATATLRVIASS
jgi:hypothetical protein